MPENNSVKKISVVIPVFNEHKTILQTIRAVQAADTCGLNKEIIVTDDGSTDSTEKILSALNDPDIRVFFHRHNIGKGAALKTGFQALTGDIIIIQDADLEYDPADYPDLIQPILQGKGDVVFGSRFIGGKPHRVLLSSHYFGNKFLTFLSDLFTGLNLTDIETGYKAFTRPVLDSLCLRENGFGFEPEFTAKVARHKFRVFEIGIAYNGRDYTSGKKLRSVSDGLRTLYCIIKYRFFD